MLCILDYDELIKLTAEWQNLLQLNHWDIRANIYRQSDFDNEDSQGEINFILSTGKAIIKIIHPMDYPNTPFSQDMEKTLVHELLHLYFAPFEPKENTLEHDFMENTIEHLSQSLVELKRANESTRGGKGMYKWLKEYFTAFGKDFPFSAVADLNEYEIIHIIQYCIKTNTEYKADTEE